MRRDNGRPPQTNDKVDVAETRNASAAAAAAAGQDANRGNIHTISRLQIGSGDSNNSSTTSADLLVST